MRQGNGSELLGMNDPRSQNIGIIYVSPNDDRKSVLAAILTHEKLGRKQVAVVLPTQQNKAFQRPVDFEDLKSMRRRLKAQIIFIAPLGQGPAEYARQRRFTVYSSLESYKQALEEEKELPVDQKKGLFGRGRTVNGGGALSANSAPSAQEEEEEEEDSASSAAPFVMGGLAGAAAARAMDDLPAKTPASQSNTMGNTGVFSLSEDDLDDEDDMLAPPPSTPAASQAATSKPASRSLQPPAESKSSIDDDGGSGPLPIELPARRARTTVQLDPKTLEPAPAPARASKARSSGTLAAGAAGAVGVAGLAAAGAATSQRANSGTAPPPMRSAQGGSKPPNPRRRRGRGWLIVLLLLLLTLVIVGGVMAYFPGTRDMLAHASLPTGQPAATLSITPANQAISDSYVITGVASNPDAARLQITARTLTQTAQQQKTVTASGHNLTQGIASTGKLTFTNGSSSPFTVAAGTTFKKASGVVIVTNTMLVIPAAVPGVSFGSGVVSAHATTVGTAGNLPAQAISGTCCTNQNFITVVNNTAFTGGQDPKDYKFVQQGDVDAVVNSLKQPLVQQAWSGVQKQMATGEQMMDGARCDVGSSTDQPVGDKGTNVPQATVTVAVKCSGTVYNRQQMLDLVKGQLQKKVDTNLGTGYALVGGMQTTMKPQTPKDGMVSFIVDAKGVWAYQLTDAQKQALAKQIAGKSVKDATALLQGQKGINKVQFSGGDVLPADPTQISIQVQSITGLSGSANPPAVTPTINSVSGTDGATAVPGNGSIGTFAITSAFAPSRRIFGFMF
jgi:hypothetical protein